MRVTVGTMRMSWLRGWTVLAMSAAASTPLLFVVWTATSRNPLFIITFRLPSFLRLLAVQFPLNNSMTIIEFNTVRVLLAFLRLFRLFRWAWFLWWTFIWLLWALLWRTLRRRFLSTLLFVGLLLFTLRSRFFFLWSISIASRLTRSLLRSFLIRPALIGTAFFRAFSRSFLRGTLFWALKRGAFLWALIRALLRALVVVWALICARLLIWTVWTVVVAVLSRASSS